MGKPLECVTIQNTWTPLPSLKPPDPILIHYRGPYVLEGLAGWLAPEGAEPCPDQPEENKSVPVFSP